MEDGRYKEDEGIVPTSPSTPPSFPRVKNCVSNCQRCIPFEKTRRNRLKLPHQHRCRSASFPHHSASKKCESISAKRWLLELSTQKCEKSGAQPWILVLSAGKCERNGAQPWILALSLEMLSSYLQFWLFFFFFLL